MTDTVLIAMISSAQTVLLAWVAMQNRKIAGTVQSVKEQTDGIHEELIASTAKSSHAEGVLDEKERRSGKSLKHKH